MKRQVPKANTERTRAVTLIKGAEYQLAEARRCVNAGPRQAEVAGTEHLHAAKHQIDLAISALTGGEE